MRARIFTAIMSCVLLVALGLWLQARREANELRSHLRIASHNSAQLHSRSVQLLRSLELALTRDPRPDRQQGLIFTGTRVPWSAIFPDGYGTKLEPPVVLGTFATPAQPAGSSLAGITWTAGELHLPDAGDYALTTNLGPVKILSLPEDVTPERKILEIAGFVAGNTVHSGADRPLLEPAPDHHCPGLLMGILFRSDQPLKLRCSGTAYVLDYLLRLHGFETRVVALETRDGSGHITVEARPSARHGWMFLDANWGYVFSDRAGNALSIEEVRSSLEQGEAVELVNIAGAKQWPIEDVYREEQPVTHFLWSPRLNARLRDPDEYRERMTAYTHSISYHQQSYQAPSERIREGLARLRRAGVPPGS